MRGERRRRMNDLIEDHIVWPLRRGDTLSNHDWFPFYGHRFLSSEFVARCVMEDRREALGTAVILWSESMRQDPAGTLPTDDMQLASLARMRSVDEWREVRDLALTGWRDVEVEDDATGRYIVRLGHPGFMMQVVADMNRRQRSKKAARTAAAHSVRKTRIKKQMAALGAGKHLLNDDRALDMLAEHFDNPDLYITRENVKVAMAEVLGVTGEVARIHSGRSPPK